MKYFVILIMNINIINCTFHQRFRSFCLIFLQSIPNTVCIRYNNLLSYTMNCRCSLYFCHIHCVIEFRIFFFSPHRKQFLVFFFCFINVRRCLTCFLAIKLGLFFLLISLDSQSVDRRSKLSSVNHQITHVWISISTSSLISEFNNDEDEHILPLASKSNIPWNFPQVIFMHWEGLTCIQEVHVESWQDLLLVRFGVKDKATLCSHHSSALINIAG